MTAAQRNAQRRQQRRKSARSSQLGWIAVGVVLVVAAVFVIIKVTGGSTPAKASSGDSAGDHPAAAPAAVTSALASIPLSAFNAIGTGGMPATLTVTAKQPNLTEGGLPKFVYEGAEYCPYCAMDRWALASALDRFGSFTGLKQIVSSATDDAYQSIPTLSFYGSKYTSPYLVFAPYETEDINQNALQIPPSDVQSLYTKYDGNSTGAGTAFDGGSGGIPFVDIANQYVSAGAPSAFSPVATALQHNGLTHTQIADALQDPSGPVGSAMGAKYLIGQANEISAAICNVDGNKPAAVCSSSGVAAAKKVLKAAKPIS
jgi:hypothetical protein